MLLTWIGMIGCNHNGSLSERICVMYIVECTLMLKYVVGFYMYMFWHDWRLTPHVPLSLASTFVCIFVVNQFRSIDLCTRMF